MPTQLGGSFTLRYAIQRTRQVRPSRIDNMKRDVIRKMKINKIRSYQPDRHSAPTYKYEIVSYSYPQYKEYLTKTGKNKKQRSERKYQRTVRHEYETILQFGEDGVTLDTTKWKCRVGSGRSWENRKPPQNQIHQIYNETVEHWRSLYNGDEEKVRKRKKQHRRKKYPYLSVGDYLSKRYGIMMDFSTRLAYVYRQHNHLFGYCYGSKQKPTETNPQLEFFLTKHTLRILDALGRKGILEKASI